MSNPLSTPARSSLASTFTPTRASSNPYGASSSSSARPTTASLIAPSPHYVTKDHKRHSLYGVEDRVVIDPGSSVWKVGFSGEAKPRAVFWANQEETVPSRSGREVASSIWDTEFEPVADSVGWRGEQERKREVGEQVVDERIARIVRDVYSK
jgi:actin-related protein 10